jgi:C-lobe and N-lobe beta barrels of Tf-binding protein B
MGIIPMRIAALLLGTSLLSACGGAGPTTAGSIAPSSGTTTTGTHTFAVPTETKTYAGIGVTQSYSYQVTTDNINNTSTGQQAQLYAGNATTVRDGSISITYNPRDAIFDINISDGKTAVSTTNRFQDPVHRTDFGGAREPQYGTPQLAVSGIQYLARSGQNTATTTSTVVNLPLAPGLIQGVLAANEFNGVYDRTTFFYQKPGTSTQYVTFGGFLRNSLVLSKTDTAAVAPVAATPTSAAIPGTPAKSITLHKYDLSRGLFVYGENASNGNVPTSGTGSFSGAMVATMVFNDLTDTIANAPSYFQMIEGTASTQFNFAANTFTVDLAGTTFAPQLDGLSGNLFSIKSGASFTANGAGKIDLAKTGGFLGQFTKAWFINPDASRFDVNIGGSSVDGAFYGPKAEEVGGSFRIVGGTPDERVDILGVFVGKK